MEIRQIEWGCCYWCGKDDIGVCLTEPDCPACGGSGIIGDYVIYEDDGTKTLEPEFCHCADYIKRGQKDYYIVIEVKPDVIKSLIREAAPKLEEGASLE